MQVDLVTRTEELERLRDEWESLEREDPHATYYVTHRFVSAWWHGFAAQPDTELRVLCLRDQGRLVGIAPFALRHTTRKGRPSRALRWASQGDYLNLLIAPDVNADTVCKAVMAHLEADAAWETLALGNVPTTAPLAGFLLKSAYNRSFTLHVENPFIDLTRYSGFDDFAARSLPSKVRKYRNKLLRDTEATFRVFRGDEDGIFDRIAEVHRKEKEFLVEAKARSERYSLYDDPARSAHIRRIFTDTDDAVTFGYESPEGQLLGYRTCFLHDRTLLSWNSAYHPDFDDYRIGKVIQFDILEHVFAEDVADRFDFGAGRYEWKFEWTADFTSTYRLQLRRDAPGRDAEQPEAAQLPKPEQAEKPQPEPTPATSRARRAAGRLKRAGQKRLRPPVIWYVPHPDDETIFMGGSIAATRDRRNIVVLLSRGAASGAIRTVSAKLPQPLTTEQFTQARLDEFRPAVRALGVAEGDVVVHDLPDGGFEVAAVHRVIADLARQHPRAQHRTMSYLDPHRDHRTAGEALRRAYDEGLVRDCLFQLPIPLVEDTLGDPVPLDRATIRAKRRALREYQVWDPDAGRYAIGGHSVAKLIKHQRKTPTERVHGPDYRPPGARSVLLLADERPPKKALAAAVDRLKSAGAAVHLVTTTRLPKRYADVPLDSTHALEPAAAGQGPAFRRALQGAQPQQRFWHYVGSDETVARAMQEADLVLALTPGAQRAARQLAERHHVLVANSPDQAVRRLAKAGDRPTSGPEAAATARTDRLPEPAVEALLRAPGISEQRRYALARRTALRLVEEGKDSQADRVVQAALHRIRTPRTRADLLGDVVSRALAHGRTPGLVVPAYAAELAVADTQHAAGRHGLAARSFGEAARTAFHRVLHFDSITSPLADDPTGFTAPLAESTVAAALRASRGRDRSNADHGRGPDDPTRLLIATRINGDFLGDIRAHFESHPDFDTRYVDFAGATALDRFAKAPELIAEQILAGKRQLPRIAEEVFRNHLDWADVIFVEWCTALAALLSQVDPKDTRIVVRVHSYEAFTVWPHLTDFTRVDDIVFVSEHLRDLMVAAVPSLREPGAPRLHVIANAMDLQRFDLPKEADARFTLGMVGASKMVKDPRWTMEVLRQLRARDERYRLLLIRGHLEDPTAATRSYIDGFERDLAELGEAVQILAHTDDVPAVLRDVGVVISASARESFHQGLVEGAASGAVPVVRDWPFFPGAPRTLFPPEWVVDSPEAAVERILATTADEDLWRHTGRDASDHVVARWDWQVVQKDFEELFRNPAG